MWKPDSPARQHTGADHILSLLHRLRLGWLLQHFPPRLVRSAYMFVNGFITIGLLALLALLSRNPFVFPSLGPTAYLLFFSPLAKASSPRNTILGHVIGILCGYGAFAVTGAGAQPFGVQHLGIFWPRILAAALSLSATGALMVLLGISHPPAGATTLIISLGIISKPRELVIIEVAVFLLAQALVINRLAGLSYPFWTGPASAKPVEGLWE